MSRLSQYRLDSSASLPPVPAAFPNSTHPVRGHPATVPLHVLLLETRLGLDALNLLEDWLVRLVLFRSELEAVPLE